MMSLISSVRLLAAAMLLLATPAAAQTSLTIYADGRVLVRRTVAAAVPAGPSTHRLELGRLDPATLFSPDAGVAITGGAYDAAVDEANTMRRAVGRTLVFETGGTRNGGGGPDTVVAVVLGVEPERFRLEDGRVLFRRPGTPRYPADLVQIEPTVALALRSTAARPSLALEYFTDGASWGASYHALLEGEQARISGTAAISSAHLDVRDAEVQLLAGEVGRAGRRLGEGAMAMAVDRAQAMPEAPREEGVGEAHLYTLPGPVTLRPGVTTTAELLAPAAAPYERRYVMRGQVPWIGPLQPFNGETTPPVEVRYLFRRPLRSSSFAAAPLPGGVWRLYQRDAGNRLQLVGETVSRHTAPGQDVVLSAGSAFDLTAKRLQTDYTTRRDSLRTRATAGYRVTIANAKDSVVTVDVLEQRQGEWRVVESSLPAERVSSTETRFRVRVPARGEAVLTYRVLVVW